MLKEPKMKLSIIIPAFNEEHSIPNVIKDIQDVLSKSDCEYEIIVVDDGSRDSTADKAREMSATVIQNPFNRGYGYAIVNGINSARYDLVATIDADSSYSAADLLKLLPHTDTYDLVVGQRTGKEYRGRLLKYPARIVFKKIAEYISGETIPDINSGLRIFNKSILLSMPKAHLCKGFSFSTTMTLLFASGGYAINHIPVSYSVRVEKSKVRYFRDTLRALQILTEIAIHYNPIKAILPFCLVPLVFSAGFTGLFLFSAGDFYLFMAVFSLYFSLLLFALGMILFQIRISNDDD
jgi:polyisoprenyl-phosphate glycosyltransferase